MALSDPAVEIERLKSQVKILTTKVAITDDLESQVALLRDQLAASHQTISDLERDL